VYELKQQILDNQRDAKRYKEVEEAIKDHYDLDTFQFETHGRFDFLRWFNNAQQGQKLIKLVEERIKKEQITKEEAAIMPDSEKFQRAYMIQELQNLLEQSKGEKA